MIFKKGNIAVVKDRKKKRYKDCFKRGQILEVIEDESMKFDELTVRLFDGKYNQELHPSEIKLISNKL